MLSPGALALFHPLGTRPGRTSGLHSQKLYWRPRVILSPLPSPRISSLHFSLLSHLFQGSLPLRHPKLFLLSFVPSPNLSHGELSHSLEGVGGLRSSSSEEDLHCIRDLGRDTLVTSKEQTTNGGISASKMGQGKLFLD